MKFCLLLALVAFTQSETALPVETKPTPLYEINRQISALCQRDSLAKTDRERATTAYEMTELYREILGDPRYATSNTLKEYRGRLWSRLTRIKKDVQAKLRRENKSYRPADLRTDTELATASATTQSLGDQFALIGEAFGGPASVFSQAGAAGGRAISDYGPDLVDLIQRTIQPEFWDVHGGPGTVVYYRPLHCLVIRATSDVHHRIGGSMDALRAAGK